MNDILHSSLFSFTFFIQFMKMNQIILYILSFSFLFKFAVVHCCYQKFYTLRDHEDEIFLETKNFPKHDYLESLVILGGGTEVMTFDFPRF